MAESSGHGGRRTGAGRPLGTKKAPAARRVATGFSCSPELAAAMDERWRAQGFKDRSAYIKALIEADLAST